MNIHPDSGSWAAFEQVGGGVELQLVEIEDDDPGRFGHGCAPASGETSFEPSSQGLSEPLFLPACIDISPWSRCGDESTPISSGTHRA
jgi:hypothetical protein